MVYGLCPDCGSKCKHFQLIPASRNWRDLRDPFPGDAKQRFAQRLLSQTTEDGERAGEEVEKREGDCGERFRAVSRCFVFFFFKQMHGCIHPSAGSPVSQAPKEAFSAELGECRGQGGWGEWGRHTPWSWKEFHYTLRSASPAKTKDWERLKASSVIYGCVQSNKKANCTCNLAWI